MGRRLALIIGVNSYQDRTFRPLQFAETDARALAQWLVNSKGGNWSPADVQLVQGSHATRELIESLITQLCVNMAGPDDSVLIYFAGHAFIDERSGEGYLALPGTQYTQPSTGLHLLSLAKQAMGNSRAGHVAFLLDCFQTGLSWDRQRSAPYDYKPLLGPTILNAISQMGDRLFLCSCRGNAHAPETGEKNLGLLTYRMIVALCGPASDPETGQITLQRLHAYLSHALGEQQRPQLFGQEQSPLVLVGKMPAPLFQTPAAGPPSPIPNLVGGMPNITGSLQSKAFVGADFSRPIGAATAQLSPTQRPQPASIETEQQSLALLRQARHLIQMQNPGQAFHLVEQALQLTPNNTAALLLKGQLLGSAGRFPDAIQCLERVIQIDDKNALAWSVRAAVLTNTGHYAEALQSVERSLELDPNNPETYAIKTSITTHMAAVTAERNSDKQKAPGGARHGGPISFFISAGIQIVGLILVLIGAVMPLFLSRMPVVAAFALQSLGFSLLCVNAARGPYLYGFTRLLLTFVLSLIPLALLGIGYLQLKPSFIQAHPSLTPGPLLFIGLSLALAGILPLVVAFVAFIIGIVRGVRR